MFVDINNTSVNMYSIASFKAVDQSVENSDGTYTTKYFIVYSAISGTVLKEEFISASERDAKMATLNETFVIK